MTETASQPFSLTDAANAISALRREVGNSVLGQSDVIDQVIVAYLGLAKPCWCAPWRKRFPASSRVFNLRPT